MKLSSQVAVAALLCALSCPVLTHAIEKAQLRERAPASQKVEFNIRLPLEHKDQLTTLLNDLQDPKSPSYHKWLKPVDFHARFDPNPAKLEAIEHELAAYGLAVTRKGPQALHVAGSVDAVEHALVTELHTAVFPSGKTTVAASRAFTLPQSMAASHATIIGLSGSLYMRPQSVRGPRLGALNDPKFNPSSGGKSALRSDLRPTPDNRYDSYGGYWFDDLKQAYKFPSYKAYTGKGSTIGILMETVDDPADFNAYFEHENLTPPKVKVVDIDGGAPFDPNGSSLEVSLDLQQTGGMAPKAKLILYNTPDLSDQSIVDALSTIVETNEPDVVTMSFGLFEAAYTAEYNNGVDFTGVVSVYEDLYAQGNAQGITFIAASGDDGGLPAVPVNCLYETSTIGCGDFQHGVLYPASSPSVVGVGGTNLKTTVSETTLASKYIMESAFYDPLREDIFYGTYAGGAVWGSGGGDSIFFTQPLYQTFVNTHSLSRTVPDLAFHMGGCPGGAIQPCAAIDSYDITAFAGYYYGVIGTSAAAPDFAGLVALKIERIGTRLGNDNYEIYALGALQQAGIGIKFFHDDVQGDNGAYKTQKGYNRVLGNGTVIGVNYLLAPSTPVAGIPQTPSNP